MNKINIVDNKFTCPLLSKEISERGEITFAACAKCNYNTLHQIVDDAIYCSFLSASSSGSSSGSNINEDTINNLTFAISNLQQQITDNVSLDRQQQEQIEANSRKNDEQQTAIENQQSTIESTVQSSVENVFTSDEMKETINNTIIEQVSQQTNPWELYQT